MLMLRLFWFVVFDRLCKQVGEVAVPQHMERRHTEEHELENGFYCLVHAAPFVGFMLWKQGNDNPLRALYAVAYKVFWQGNRAMSRRTKVIRRRRADI